MIIELVGTRILSPFYGTTIYVWSSLITVALVFLALGYFFGGKLADKRPQMAILYLLVFFAAACLILISKFDSQVLQMTDSLGTRGGALSSAFILFFPPFLLLGMVIPYAIKGKAEELIHIGATSGNIYAVSTLGSFVGTIGAGFVLIPNLSISSILNLIAFVLFVTAVVGIILEKKYKWLFLIILFILLLLIPTPSSALMKVVKIVYQTESSYAQIKVVDIKVPDRENLRFLLVNGAPHTKYDLNTGEFFPYLRLMEKAIKYHSKAKNALSLGLGGGGIDQLFRAQGIEVDNVEIDPKIVAVAKEYFGFDGNVAVADARTYIRRTNKKYDLILGDVYAGYSPEPHLVTKEAFEEMKAKLQKKGILVLNILGIVEKNKTAEKLYEKAVYKTLNKVFPYVYVKGTEGYGFQNIVFYASDYALKLDDQFVSVKIFPDEKTPILTDDYNPVEALTIPHSEAWRKVSMKGFSQAVLYQEERNVYY